MHLWRIAKGVILTNEARCQRGLALDPSFPCCRSSPETIAHVFRDCPVAIVVWMEVRHIYTMDQFFNSNFCVWLQENVGRDGTDDWSTLFGVVLDVLWWARNDLVFNNLNCDSHTLVCIAKNTIGGINQAQAMFGRTHVTHTSSPAPSCIRWIPPPQGWFKLNCDGARSETQRKATCGRVLRDHGGCFCLGFSANLGDCSLLQAELWVVLYGIRFAWAQGFHNLIIESDSLLAIDLSLEVAPQDTLVML